jgi:predicted transcriptional regulator
LNKIAEDIQRNINFHQVPNRKLNKLIETYKEFANSDNVHLNKLDKLLSQLDDGEFSPN